MSDMYQNCREPRNAGVHPHQMTSLAEQRKNQFFNNLQQPIANIIGRPINCYEIDFSDEEWLRNIIRTYPALEAIYQEVKQTIASAVSTQYFGESIERNLLEQEFIATVNESDKEEYLNSLTKAIQKLLDGYDITNDGFAQRAYDTLNQRREEITSTVSSIRDEKKKRK